jgi:hypothetical protein
MSTLFDRVKKQGSRGGGGNVNETFAIELESYEVVKGNPEASRIVGKRLDNGETVKVGFLPDPRGEGPHRYPRPEVADFAKKREYKNDPGTVPGGVLIVESAIKEGDEYKARWVKVGSHKPGEADVFSALARVNPPTDKRGGKGQYQSVDTIDPDRAVECNSLDEIKAALAEALEPKGKGQPYALVQAMVVRNGTVAPSEIIARQIAGMRKAGTFEWDSGEASLAVRLTDDRGQQTKFGTTLEEIGKEMGRLDGLLVRVVPGERHFVGPQAMGERLSRIYCEEHEANGGKTFQTVRWSPSIIALWHLEDGGSVVSYATPCSAAPWEFCPTTGPLPEGTTYADGSKAAQVASAAAAAETDAEDAATAAAGYGDDDIALGDLAELDEPAPQQRRAAPGM